VGRTQNNEISDESRRPHNPYASHPEGLKIALLRPRIPQNTGSVARMCAATGCSLDIVAPFFQIDDKKLKRAGLDYWPHLDVFVFDSLEEWLERRGGDSLWFLEVGAPRFYTEARFAPRDILVFGDEEEGIPAEWLCERRERHLSIPQKNVRSLNLATSVGIVTYEALRQLSWRSIL